MNLKNVLRNLLSIRAARSLPPPSPKPPVGSNIVRGDLRIRLKYPIDDEQWEWLIANEWRVVDMRVNRRRYVSVSDSVAVKVLGAGETERNVLHERLVNVLARDRDASSRHPSSPQMQASRLPKRSSADF